MINHKGETRPMVDLTGKYYTLEELDETFIEKCVDVAAYSHHAGDYVKNAFDPRFNEDGIYDAAAAAKAEDLNIVISIEMKRDGQAFRIEKQTHNYPHCWRTDKPVLYYPLDSWFIRTTAARDRLIALNSTINWKPASTGSGRFGKWLENVQDWNLSRSRYWGTPLPIWRTEDGKFEKCIGSVEELYNEIERAVAAGVMTVNPLREKGFEPGNYAKSNYEKIDLHRPYVDDIVLVSEDGRPMHRETDLIDVWFDSGSMPYAQQHYPFEHKEDIDNGTAFPADFIAEGVDQTRGWFFTLHAIAGMIFDSVAYRNVVSNGLVLDKDGNKMSKRLGNAVNPFEAIEKYGSDPLRWYMISNSSPWDNLKFDPAGVQESARKFFATIYNTYSFFALYANVDGFDTSTAQVPMERRPEIDRWIISVLNTLIQDVDRNLADYEPTRAARAIADFVGENLSNWYVRLNRKRFWGGGMTEDKLAAYQTLYQCLKTVALLMAPVSPFYADNLYRDLTGCDASVHLALFPEADTAVIDADLETRMRMAQSITSMVLALRRKVNIKVRQPLSVVMIPVNDDNQRRMLQAVKDLVLSEVNIKEMNIVDSDTGILVKRIKPDFKKLGPKFGKQMKSVAQALTAFDTADVIAMERDGYSELTLADGTKAKIDIADVEIISEDIPGWQVANDGNLTVAIDVIVTDELRREGIAREIVNRVQNIRKSRDYAITDRICLSFGANPETDEAIKEYKDYISTQVLAKSIEIMPNVRDNYEALTIDDITLPVNITRDK